MRALFLLTAGSLNLAAAPAPRLDGRTPAERGDALVAYVATCKPSAKDETYPKASAPAYAARLLRGVETAYALEKLDASKRTAGSSATTARCSWPSAQSDRPPGASRGAAMTCSGARPGPTRGSSKPRSSPLSPAAARMPSSDASPRRFSNARRIDATGLDQQPPRFRYTTLGGRPLDFTWLPHRQPYAGQAKIDGQAVDYASWPLHGNPWVRQKTGEPTLHLQHGKDRLSYDFIRWTRRAWQAESP